jgi:hypothetical protein
MSMSFLKGFSSTSFCFYLFGLNLVEVDVPPILSVAADLVVDFIPSLAVEIVSPALALAGVFF